MKIVHFCRLTSHVSYFDSPFFSLTLFAWNGCGRQMSLPKKEDEDVAAGMAAIAHLLSTVDKSVLTTFLQSTLMSMLRNIRALRQGDDEFESLFPISSRVRRAQQSLTDEEMPTEGSWDEEVVTMMSQTHRTALGR